LWCSDRNRRLTRHSRDSFGHWLWNRRGLNRTERPGLAQQAECQHQRGREKRRRVLKRLGASCATQSAQQDLQRHSQLGLDRRSDTVSSHRGDERRSQLVQFSSDAVSSSNSRATQSARDKEEERRSQLLLSPRKARPRETR